MACQTLAKESLGGQPPVAFWSSECSLEHNLDMVDTLRPVVDAIE